MTSPDLDTYRQRANRRARRRWVVSSVLIPVVVLLGLVVAGLSTQPPLKMHVLVLVGGFSTATYLLGLFAVLGFTGGHDARWHAMWVGETCPAMSQTAPSPSTMHGPSCANDGRIGFSA
jgi:hypothetical protein